VLVIDPETDARALAAEAQALHRAVFGGSAPDLLIDSYVAAHRIVRPAAQPDGEAGVRRGEASVRRAIERGLDLEALELTWRIRRPQHPLVQKTQILVYLAEALPEYQARIVGGTQRTGGALWKLCGHVVRSLAKYLQGVYLILRHRLE
jgi:hypothetical protein